MKSSKIAIKEPFKIPSMSSPNYRFLITVIASKLKQIDVEDALENNSIYPMGLPRGPPNGDALQPNRLNGE